MVHFGILHGCFWWLWGTVCCRNVRGWPCHGRRGRRSLWCRRRCRTMPVTSYPRVEERRQIGWILCREWWDRRRWWRPKASDGSSCRYRSTWRCGDGSLALSSQGSRRCGGCVSWLGSFCLGSFGSYERRRWEFVCVLVGLGSLRNLCEQMRCKTLDGWEIFRFALPVELVWERIFANPLASRAAPRVGLKWTRQESEMKIFILVVLNIAWLSHPNRL